ncbi:uncharacterized protein LOC144225508 isoform X3 [Crocuta crocuta]
MLSLSLTCGYWENTWPLKSDRSRFESELAVSTLFDLGSSWKATLEDKTILCPATVSMFCGSVGKEDTLKGGGQLTHAGTLEHALSAAFPEECRVEEVG